MRTHKKKTEKENTILFSGGIGDAYIVFCKIYTHHQKTQQSYRLLRFDQVVDYDKPLEEFFSLIPYIAFVKAQPLQQLDEHRAHHPYLGVHALGQPFGFSYVQEPKEFCMTPYPTLPLTPTGWKGKHIGIQLQTGKEKGNFKGLPLRWIAQTVRQGPQDAQWHLLGTGTSYSKEVIEKFCTKHSIHNHVGKTNFLEWMRLIRSLDYYITPEGFSAFFALSQNVRCHVFYTIKEDLVRIHPSWKEHATFEEVKNTIQIFPLFQGKIIQRIRPQPLKVIL